MRVKQVFKAVTRIVRGEGEEKRIAKPEPEPEDNREGYLPAGEEDVEFSSWWSDVHRKARSVDVRKEYNNYKHRS